MLDQYIQPHDSRIFASSLLSISVSRPELDAKGSGNPRSLKIKFEFGPNEDFEDSVLEKAFWYRRASDGWTGLVSEPVRVHWKEGKDLSNGLTDLAADLFNARKKLGDMTAKGLPEYTKLKKQVESWNGMNTSFFTWFGWVSSRRYVTVEESQTANASHESEKVMRQAGRKTELHTEEMETEMQREEELDDEAVEVHQEGEDLAISLAEELWPNAIKFFTQAQEIEEMSDADFEDDDGIEEMDAEDGDEDDEPIDIRSLVQPGKGKSKDNGGPPSKKRKT